MCASPVFLTLRPEFREEFRNRAIANFGQKSYIADICRAIASAQEIKLSKDTVYRILGGSRGRAISVQAICTYYEVDWFDACIEQEHSTGNIDDIDSLVRRIRSKADFRFEYSSRSLGPQRQRQWIQDNFIEPDLVEVEFLPSEYPVGDPDALRHSPDSQEDDFDRTGLRLLRGKKTTGMRVLDSHKDIFVYGEPGSGKTSYLQWIALKCCEGVLLEGYVPIFVAIRQFVTTSQVGTLFTYFEEMFERWGSSASDARRVIESGRAVFIFDGLDETPGSERDRIESMIERLRRDYVDCRYILSSRLASDIPFFGGLQKVIIAPLQPRRHIPQFVNRWFAQPGKQPAMAEMMLEKLQVTQYQGIRELARRPVLLKLLCIVFEVNGDFPTRRGDVFKSGIREMTRAKADLETRIPAIPQLEDTHIYNILCRVASYFFIDLKVQTLFAIRDVERLIQDYFAEVHHIRREEVPGHIILNGIEKSNGLLVRWAQNFCAFSHLTYQEFFTAEHLVSTGTYTSVYDHLYDSRWHFVIGLVAELIPPEAAADFFLGFKQTIDDRISQDSKLREFLESLNRAATFSTYSIASQQPHLQTYIRAWYFAYALHDTGTVTNPGILSRSFDLPDFEFATSMVSGPILEGHGLIYKAYHALHGKAPVGQRFIVLIGRLKRFLSDNPQKVEVLEGWSKLIQKEQAAYQTPDDWWLEKQKSWCRRMGLFIQGLGLPNVADLTRDQQAKLRAYYDVTKLLSTCINRAQLDQTHRKQFADSMLLLTAVPPPSLGGFEDAFSA